MTTPDRPIEQSGEFRLADRVIYRLGYGSMRLTGDGVWGPPKGHDNAIAVLRRAVELGVNFIDTADSYGPYVAEELICEALHPYDGVVVATKAGFVRTGPRAWHPLGRPEYLRQECEMSLRRLNTDAIDLFQLHRIDPQVRREDQFGLLAALLEEGKVRAVGLSEVSVDDLEAAQEIVPVASVQNRYNLADRGSEPVLEACALSGIGFIPWYPIGSGELANEKGPLRRVADELSVTPAQLAIAWLLQRDPVVLPIPGTSSLQHLEENCAAAGISLDADQVRRLEER